VVTFYGTNLLNVSSVLFNGIASPWSGAGMDGSFYTAVVPTDATTGPVTIVNRSDTFTTSDNFTVLGFPPPQINAFRPESASVGTALTLEGRGLLRATEVRFNGVPAAFWSASDGAFNLNGYLVAIVPTNASTGPIAVLTPEGAAVSIGSLTILPDPAVFGFDIPAGPPGTVVEILGAGFADVSWVALGDTNFKGWPRLGAELCRYLLPSRQGDLRR
jgi:hypothetical protein